MEHITQYIAGVQQRYTQSGGTRPFGIATIVIGFDSNGSPRLFQTDPAGIYSEWKAEALGKNAKAVREYLEKNYVEGDEETSLRIAVRALMEGVEASTKNMEVAVLVEGQPLRYLDDEAVETLLAELQEAREAERTARREEE